MWGEGLKKPPRLTMTDSGALTAICQTQHNGSLFYVAGAGGLSCWGEGFNLVSRLDAALTSSASISTAEGGRFVLLNGSFWFDQKAWLESEGKSRLETLDRRLLARKRISGTSDDKNFFFTRGGSLFEYDCCSCSERKMELPGLQISEEGFSAPKLR